MEDSDLDTEHGVRIHTRNAKLPFLVSPTLWHGVGGGIEPERLRALNDFYTSGAGNPRKGFLHRTLDFFRRH